MNHNAHLYRDPAWPLLQSLLERYPDTIQIIDALVPMITLRKEIHGQSYQFIVDGRDRKIWVKILFGNSYEAGNVEGKMCVNASRKVITDADWIVSMALMLMADFDRLVAIAARGQYRTYEGIGWGTFFARKKRLHQSGGSIRYD